MGHEERVRIVSVRGVARGRDGAQGWQDLKRHRRSEVPFGSLVPTAEPWCRRYGRTDRAGLLVTVRGSLTEVGIIIPAVVVHSTDLHILVVQPTVTVQGHVGKVAVRHGRPTELVTTTIITARRRRGGHRHE